MNKSPQHSHFLIGILELLESSISILNTARDGTILYVNESFCQLMGYQSQELIGQNVRILNSGIHDQAYFQNLWQTILSGQVWHHQLCSKKKDGSSIWIETYIGPVFNEHQEIEEFISIRFDLTKERNSEKLLEAQAQQIAVSTKMATLGEVTAGLAHEITNLLSIITGKTSILIRRLASGQMDYEKLPQELEKIYKTAERVSTIVKSLRRFSRNEQRDPFVAIPAQQFIEDAIELSQEMYKQDAIELKKKLAITPNLSVKGHSAQLSQVIVNLLSNAHDAIANLPEKWVEVDANFENDHLIVRVTDSGSGIPEEVANKIMQPFFTTKPAGKGTGLGLSISNGIIQEHGGILKYNCRSPKTQFVIELPICERG